MSGYARDTEGTIHEWFAACEERGFTRVVVIDPEDREQVERLVCGYYGTKSAVDSDVDQMYDALRSLVPPARPEEPTGLGAVVEDEDGVRWVNVFEKGMWQDHRNRNTWSQYGDIKAVRVLSEGVTE